MSMARPMDSTANLPRSSVTTFGRTTLRYFWKPSGLIICFSAASSVPELRISASMTAKRCFADSTTNASGRVEVSLSANAFSSSLWTVSVVLSSSWPPTVFSTSCLSSSNVKPGRIFPAKASLSSGKLLSRTALMVTSKPAFTPASGCSSRYCLDSGKSTGTVTFSPAFFPIRASTTPGRNLPGSKMSSRSSPPTAPWIGNSPARLPFSSLR
mmetsp:Transcript_23333/g.60853  ORF Transcript_23333/g.60853 Transcript_23333/m.60853 type:complete len:212 (+) Transcript_23333:311-946(+)